MGILNDAATLENSLAAPQNVKQLPWGQEIPFLGAAYAHEKWNTCLPKNLYMNARNSITHNGQKVDSAHI